MKLDMRIVVRAAVIATWAGFLGWLWASGEMVRYLGPRTYWVIVFGTIVLGLAALAHLPWLMSHEGSAVGRREVISALVVVAPLALVVAVPQPSLGSLAASRKASFGGGAGPALIVPDARNDGSLSFIDFYYGDRSEGYAAEAGLAEGRVLALEGFVSRASASGLDLTRFYISCCAADAVPYSVHVVHPPRTVAYEANGWLRVRGVVARDDRGRYVLEATAITPMREPRDPYL